MMIHGRDSSEPYENQRVHLSDTVSGEIKVVPTVGGVAGFHWLSRDGIEANAAGQAPRPTGWSNLRALSLAVALLTTSGCPTSTPGPPSVPRSKLPDDTSIHWLQADTLAIKSQNDPNSDVWNAGHVNDILKFNDDGMIVATDTGGVWEITTKGQALPLSDSWTSIDMTSLALGPDSPRHLYAATYNTQESPGGYLYETDSSAPAPLVSWRQVNPKPACTSIQKVLVVNRLIVLACDTGIWWSNVPPTPSVSGTYQWKQAVGAPSQLSTFLQSNFSGLALGPTVRNGQPTIIASAWGGTTAETEIYWGSWSNSDLVFQSSNVPNLPGQLFSSFGRTSLASCAQDSTLAYAVAADPNDVNMAAVWRSNDGGHNWTTVTLPANAGGQGGYNNSIAVARDCHAVAVGWEGGQSGGTFVSYDSGNSWTKLTDNVGLYNNMHADVHALTFDPADPTTLYIGSDGGVASASGLVQGGTPTYISNYNRQLFDMQLYHAAASSQVSGLVTAGLQDNGVLFAQLPGAWERLTDCGCDGDNSRFVSPSGLTPGTDILIEGEFSGANNYPWCWVHSNANGNPVFGFNNQQGILTANSQNTIPSNAPVGVVKNSRYTNNAGQNMYGVAGFTQNVYGLFANSDGSNIHWESLGLIGSGQNVSAVSSADGTDVFVGTDHGNIFRLDSPYDGSAVQLTVDPPTATGTGNVSAIIELFPSIAFAAFNVGNSGYVLVWKGQTWDPVGGSLPSGLPFTTIEAPDLGSVFVASRTNVYSSHNLGNSWMIASDGLPMVAQGTDLHVVTQPGGSTYLYLATYGWSLWRAALP